MILLIARLTLAQLLGQKRIYLLLVFAALPVLLMVILRLTMDDDANEQEGAAVIATAFHMNLLLPLVALILGTAALGQEIEDGTAVYLLSRPIARWKIIVAKLGAAWVAGSVLMIVSIVISLGIGLLGEEQQGIIPAFAVASFVGAGLYCAFFISLSVFTGRALVIGLIYVFIWETVVTNLAQGVKYFSIREYSLAVADKITSVDPDFFEADLSLTAALIGASVAAVLFVSLGIYRLGSFELGERM